jgi:3-hydroxymyristoyl/3-hydroxydecanoyl-(acyl carrier protein) dehydratase
MNPIELQRSAPDADRLVLRLWIPKTLFWFRGHFPQWQVLPGVAQIHWAMAYSESLTGDLRYHSVDRVKFQTPVMPDSELRLELYHEASRQLLHFCYYLVDGESERVASSGKVKLCR